jgi:hypothetical protein
MSILARLVKSIVPCAAGAAGALIVVVAAGSRGAAPTRASPDPPAIRTHVRERPLAEVAATRSTADLPPQIQEDAARLREEGRLRWHRRLDDHGTEPLDPAWAANVAARFQADLASMAADGGFRPVAVRCHSRTCAAEVEYPSFDAATQGFQDLLVAPYALGCGTQTVLEEPADPSVPYVATVLFDCSEI